MEGNTVYIVEGTSDCHLYEFEVKDVFSRRPDAERCLIELVQEDIQNQRRSFEDGEMHEIRMIIIYDGNEMTSIVDGTDSTFNYHIREFVVR